MNPVSKISNRIKDPILKLRKRQARLKRQCDLLLGRKKAGRDKDFKN
jgi:hypothetical protein